MQSRAGFIGHLNTIFEQLSTNY